MKKIVTAICFFLAGIYATCALPMTNLPTTMNTESQPTSERVQEIVCAIDSIKALLSSLQHVEVYPCLSAGLSCSPETSTNPTIQASIVGRYAQYIAETETADNYSNSYELLNVLDSINNTLFLLQNDVNYISSPAIIPTVPICHNDHTFRYNCSIHLFNSSLHHYLSLHLHNLPDCSFCTGVSVQEEQDMIALHQFFRGNYFDQLLPLQCRIPFYFGQYQMPSECLDDPYILQSRLESLTQWMNSTLSHMNQSLLELEYLVDNMSSTILPASERALSGLRRREMCLGTTVTCTAPLLELEAIEEATSQFALPECFPEPNRLQSATIAQLYDLTRQTFNTLFVHFSLLEIITA